MNTRFNPGDAVRTPRGHIGTVHANLLNGKAEVDVEITSIERFMEEELEHASPGAIAQIQELERGNTTLLKQLGLANATLNDTLAKAAKDREALAEVRDHNARQSRLIERLSRTAPKKSPAKKRR